MPRDVETSSVGSRMLGVVRLEMSLTKGRQESRRRRRRRRQRGGLFGSAEDGLAQPRRRCGKREGGADVVVR